MFGLIYLNLTLIWFNFSIPSQLEIQASVLFSFTISCFVEPTFTQRPPINRRSVKMIERVQLEGVQREGVAWN